jgi:hypothetical protein
MIQFLILMPTNIRLFNFQADVKILHVAGRVSMLT